MMRKKGIVPSVVGLWLVAMHTAACSTLRGAAIGAGVDGKDRGRGAKNGALIGAGVGAAAGTIYGWRR